MLSRILSLLTVFCALMLVVFSSSTTFAQISTTENQSSHGIIREMQGPPSSSVQKTITVKDRSGKEQKLEIIEVKTVNGEILQVVLTDMTRLGPADARKDYEIAKANSVYFRKFNKDGTVSEIPLKRGDDRKLPKRTCIEAKYIGQEAVATEETKKFFAKLVRQARKEKKLDKSAISRKNENKDNTEKESISISTTDNNLVAPASLLLKVTYNGKNNFDLYNKDQKIDLNAKDNTVEFNKTENTVKLNYLLPGDYSIIAKVKDTNGKELKSDELKGTIAKPPAPVVKEFSFSSLSVEKAKKVLVTWNVTGAQLVKLNGEKVEPSGKKEYPIEKATEFFLEASIFDLKTTKNTWVTVDYTKKLLWYGIGLIVAFVTFGGGEVARRKRHKNRAAFNQKLIEDDNKKIQAPQLEPPVPATQLLYSVFTNHGTENENPIEPIVVDAAGNTVINIPAQQFDPGDTMRNLIQPPNS